MIYRLRFACRRATPRRNAALAYDAFCNPRQRNQIIEIMRRYALKEDGDERGAARNRFQAKHLTGAVLRGISRNTFQKNIDGYALDGQLDNDTGRPLKDTAAAVTAWASTWRIPQFKTVGLPTMGLTVNYVNCLAASALLMSLTSAAAPRRRRQW